MKKFLCLLSLAFLLSACNQAPTPAPEESTTTTEVEKTEPEALEEAAGEVPEEVLPPGKKPVKITKYFDFGCGYCRKGAQAMQDLKAKYGDEVAIELRHFVIHPPVMGLHEASECAREQGKFEAFFYNYFLENYGASADRVVKAIDLDRKAYDVCMAKPEGSGIIQSHKSIGQLLGISGTPHFIVNDTQRVGGYASFETFEKIVEQNR